MHRFTLCIVTQDAELSLGACIASATNLVEEIVVVDTGSHDETVNIAESSGALVIHHLRSNDPSAALRAALNASSGDWILILQPDETLAPRAPSTLIEAIESETFDYALLPVIDSDALESSIEDVLQGKTQIGVAQYLPRLLKRTALSILQAGDLLDQTSWNSDLAPQIPAPIVKHALSSRETTYLEKADELIELERAVARNPRDWLTRAHLSEAYFDSNQLEKASEECDIAWTLVQASWRLQHQMLSTPRGTTKVAHLRSVLQIRRGDFNAALDTIRTARNMGAIHPNLDYVFATAQEQMALWAVTPEARNGHLAIAREQFSAAISQHGRSYGEPLQHGVTSWSAGVRLGIVLLQENQPDRAMRCFQAALARSPDPIDAILGIAETLLVIGQPAETLLVLDAHLSRETADGWLLAADAANQLGENALFNEYLQQACDVASTRLRSLHRLARLEILLERPQAS